MKFLVTVVDTRPGADGGFIIRIRRRVSTTVYRFVSGKQIRSRSLAIGNTFDTNECSVTRGGWGGGGVHWPIGSILNYFAGKFPNMPERRVQKKNAKAAEAHDWPKLLT